MDFAWHRKIYGHMYWSTCRIFGERVAELQTPMAWSRVKNGQSTVLIVKRKKKKIIAF